MHKFGIYFNLAKNNMKANYRLYVPYLLASTMMIMMFYIILMLAMDPGMNIGQLSAMLGSGSFVVGLFAVVFILYINSFLMRHRTKEFGLYNVLGMDKPQIAGIVLIETLISFVIGVAGGILFGTLFSKLIQLLLLRLIQYGGNLTMQISPEAALDTIIVFAVIYFLAYLSTLRKVYRTKPIDLMEAENAGEKIPRANWLMALVGVIVLGAGYWMAVYVQSPREAFASFFTAVALVMVGTVLLFTSCSVALLRLLQKNKKFYYKKNHFINVSGLMYRMKQNAAGLAQICILSCMVLVTISMTVSIYYGTEDMLSRKQPRDMVVTAYVYDAQDAETYKNEILALTDIEKENGYSYSTGSSYIRASEVNGMSVPSTNESVSVKVMPISIYNQLSGNQITLQDNEAVIYSANMELQSDTISFRSTSMHVNGSLKDIPDELKGEYLETDSRLTIFCNDPFALTGIIQNAGSKPTMELTVAYNTTASEEQQQSICTSINKGYFAGDVDGHADCMATVRGDAYSIIGGLMFVGIFLGGLFLIATVLIIYYKQVSEGYEDKHRFEILQQVGLSKGEVRKCINAQVLTVFFLPLAVALLHIVFAYHIVYELLLAFSVDSSIFIYWLILTAAVFAVIYALVYLVTSRTYYKIVESK